MDGAKPVPPVPSDAASSISRNPKPLALKKTLISEEKSFLPAVTDVDSVIENLRLAAVRDGVLCFPESTVSLYLNPIEIFAHG